MKNFQRAILSIAILTGISASAAGIPPASDALTSHYLINAHDMSRVHVGFSGYVGDRDVKKGAFTSEAEMRRYVGFVGYDVFPWLTAYALVGNCSCKIKSGRYVNSEGSDLMLGAGLWANLIDNVAYDFPSTITHYRVRANVEFAACDYSDYSYTDVSGAVVFELYNEIPENWTIGPDNLGVYAGPCFSFMDLQGYETSSRNNVGITAGIVLESTTCSYLDVGCDVYRDGLIARGTIGIRF